MALVRSKKSKMLNSVLILCLIILIAVSIPQIGIIFAGILILLLTSWLIWYNSVSYNRLFVNEEKKV